MDGKNSKRKGLKPHEQRTLPKRRKVQGGGGSPGSSRRAVPVDALAWRTVDLPGVLDDAEGFYGLEEVDGVEVIRSGGQVQFMTSTASVDEDEFEGFEDVPSTDAQADKSQARDVEEDALITSPEPLKKTPRAVAVENRESSSGDDSDDEKLESELFTKLRDVDVLDDQEDDDLSSWSQLDLSLELLSSLAKLRFQTPTPIQSAAIPEIVAGHDVIGKASTGSGKTLAFAIPVVERWLSGHRQKKPEQKPLALVISPTRELAHQITKHIKDLCAGLADSPYICSVTGGLSVHKQQRQLEDADIVIGTPGRLWEVLSSSASLLTSFKGIRFLVLDEADRLLSEGHFKEAEEIFSALDKTEFDEDGKPATVESSSPRQTLVFSATFNKSLQQKLGGKGRLNLMDKEQSLEYLLKRINFRERPKYLDMNPISQMAAGLQEGLIECGAMEKDLYLYAALLLRATPRTLVFANSISAVRRITPMLQNLNLSAYPLHSQMPQKARLRSLERFASAQPRSAGAKAASSILVATDVAARGLDIPDTDLVIHYHVPRAADAYVHRSGRTARAEKTGVSILLCSPEEVVPTRRLVAKVHATAQAKQAENGVAGEKKKARKDEAGHFFIQTVDIDRKLVSRLRERVTLAKAIADTTLAKEKGRSDDAWMRSAAEDLGVEYDSDELEAAGRWSGRGSGRKQQQKEARSLTRADVSVLRADLKRLLSRRVNLGVSEKYITSGKVDVAELLRGGKGDFLGPAASMDFEA